MKNKINGKRIILRKFRLSDSKELLKHVNDFELTQFLIQVEPPMSEKKEKQFIKDSWKKMKNGRAFTFAIEFKKTKKLIGCIALSGIDKEHKYAEIGIWVAKNFWGKGIGAEATKLLINFGFNELGLHRIEYRHLAENKRSANLIKKLGGKREGKKRETILKRGKWHDEVFYGILKEEWNNCLRNK